MYPDQANDVEAQEGEMMMGLWLLQIEACLQMVGMTEKS